MLTFAQRRIDLRRQQQQLMHECFQLVKNPTDWKAPIDKVIDLPGGWEDVRVVQEAIRFMTATDATVTRMDPENSPNRFWFCAPGYRNGPAGP